jgi:DNA-binding NarL/FixJ family response regulator
MSSPPGGRIRVLVVDDDPLVRAGLQMMLGGADDLEVVGEAGDGAAALAWLSSAAADVVLMDIRMPGMDGLTATREVRARPEPPEVVVLTTFDADAQVLAALRAGAAGFLLKDTSPGGIVGAIREVAAGRPVLSPQVMRRLVERVSDSAHDHGREAARARLSLLNDRERAVASEVAAGKSNAEIASALFLSVPTVKTHISAVLTKLDLNNRVQIALLAHDAGLGEAAP